jgi:putative ABC transport system ATP-binding protein
LSGVALVEIQHLTRSFGALRALDGVSLSIAEGSWVAITGPSGSGKTTLLNILSGLDRATAGRVIVDGLELGALSPRRLAEYRRQKVGLVFQQFHLLPYLDAVENVMLAQYLHSMADRGEAEEALRGVGLGSRLRHLPRELSGGEQQRVAIARALINQPKLVLADEPTGNLDGVNEAVVMSLFDELHRAGHTVILVTHDPAIAARADLEIRLEHGRLADAESGPVQSAPLLLDLWRALEEGAGSVSIERRGVAEMLADGRLRFEGGRLHFTDSGRTQAAEAVRRQRLGEALLERTLERGREEDCGAALPVAASIVGQVCAFLEHPRACPHGRPIPAGDGCCFPRLVRGAVAEAD